MRVIHEQKVRVPVRKEELDLILGMYDIPILGKLYSIRSPMSNIISIGILPNAVSDPEAIVLAARAFEQSKGQLQDFLVYREGASVIPLLEKVGGHDSVEKTTELAGSDEKEG